MATIVKKCDHTNGQWRSCKHNWVVRYRDSNGKQRENGKFKWDQKEVANAFSLKIEHDKSAGEWVDPKAGSVKFGPYADLRIKQMTAAPTTKSRYLGILNNHLGMLHGRSLHSVANDRDGIQTLLSETLPAKGLGRAQVELCSIVITSTLNTAVKAGKITAHRLHSMDLPEANKQAHFHFASKAELEALEAALPAEWRLTVWLGRGCGRRIGEALAVQESCIRDNYTVLRVYEQVTSGTTTGPLKHRKEGDFIDVPLPSYVADKVKAHIKKYGTHEGGYLFHGPEARFISDSTWNNAFGKAREAAKLPDDYGFHALRHTFASVALSRGIPITDVAAWLGHKDINVTYRIYRHWIPSNLGKARVTLDTEFKEWGN